MQIQPCGPLRGEITVPGDKSISHRAVMLGALANGTTHITGFLMGEDCLSTIDCFRKMGVEIEITDSEVIVEGVGLHGLCAPEETLYTGNSGTTTRLLCGILAGQPFTATLNGDASIQKRPMGRVIKPLREMGASIEGKNDNYCPLTLYPSELYGIEYRLPVASAQLKSAILLAGLYAEGQTTVIEPAPSRDHTERMFRALGVEVETHGSTITLEPPEDLYAVDIRVPGDISSAAFFLVAGAIVEGSELTIRNVGVNPTRTGILDVLHEMGADISISNFHDDAEPVCDLTVKHSMLRGVEIGGSIIPRLIDELPVIAVAAAYAEGETVIRDAQELKVKESNRIAAMVTELKKAGVDAEETDDGMIIRGGKRPHGAAFETYKDHRIAMSLAVLALAARSACRIDEPEVVAISYPDFFHTLERLGG
ncbi:3-phosphoshikimate 1-carboxyvinyltransferase [Agathobaculum sp. NSJ-28]|uniref:3-phosphoshikimate 1-carboxyvinyltransferase n=2 Tax=Agathobaculum TaxID=2048137 RepID=A0A923LVE8_9FIRM|nr:MULTISPECIES: 3-phosphoshikimate 1-carboxyvinyltransferase [Butyricicoccaceae]MBS6882364.1 3-phosphoshikimate 1-carboxyvinyltransferase [Clostridiaceae bacterium]SCJ06208.1 3-phosphoshikimate 1-carboxyvinyltransferase 1 [uncultured Butyricicoccus sp.]MBC5725889.1 3-phosphoshikimate 1-carboxyvinyltransferase [Agathobaculum faecis]MCU6789128.1 3-phosphoshikimate 1-carboxyvinyltransferase [Agathobaculum ammoniilyticum]WOC74345.1 3-phosphoshikimate 1-carboxyvinyltransferase [Intestinibacillus s